MKKPNTGQTSSAWLHKELLLLAIHHLKHSDGKVGLAVGSKAKEDGSMPTQLLNSDILRTMSLKEPLFTASLLGPLKSEIGNTSMQS